METKTQPKEQHAEENVLKERVDHLIEHRVPWLFFGLLGGLVTTMAVSNYESMLSADVRLSFFIPVIVYLSDAIGTQTETIYVRALSTNKKLVFAKYILKETFVGLGLGIISGTMIGGFAAYWLDSIKIGATLGLTMIINLTIAPILAVLVPTILYRRHADPALGSGPVATIIQDLLSLIVYFMIADIIIF